MNKNQIGTNENGYSFPNEILTRIKNLSKKINDFEKYPDLWREYKIKFINMSLMQQFILFETDSSIDVVTSFSTNDNAEFIEDELKHCENCLDIWIEKNVN
jgi:hypothetical protein